MQGRRKKREVAEAAIFKTGTYFFKMLLYARGKLL